MNSQKRSIGRFVIAATAFALVMLAFLLIWSISAPNRSGRLGHILRWAKGETVMEQGAHDLAEELHKNPQLLSELHEWCMDTLSRFRKGNIKLSSGSDLVWTLNASGIALDEIPEFIKDRWLETNRFGTVWPKAQIVFITNHVPDYVVINWNMYGIVVGPTNFRPSFNVDGFIQVQPGVYTYYRLE